MLNARAEDIFVSGDVVGKIDFTLIQNFPCFQALIIHRRQREPENIFSLQQRYVGLLSNHRGGR